ncbi:MAG: 30S ribosome-binding factor RbfA [Chloroflexi bacterium]|nr:30S ribosome-binding factor RbfA [Chloroflexota bacterium]
MTRRVDRVNALLRQEISQLLVTEIKDPRLSSVLSITHVDISKDLRYAKVFVSVLGDKGAKAQSIQALNSATGFLRRELSRRLSFRNTPELRFVLDDSIEYGARLLEIIEEIAPNSGNSEEPL